MSIKCLVKRHTFSFLCSAACQTPGHKLVKNPAICLKKPCANPQPFEKILLYPEQKVLQDLFNGNSMFFRVGETSLNGRQAETHLLTWRNSSNIQEHHGKGRPTH